MTGEPIEAVKNGVQMMVHSLRQNPQAIETAFVSIITFDSEAKQLIPLTDLASFQTVDLKAAGTTALGAALSLLADKLENEVTKTTLEQKGDWKPVVFLLTDGAPTDDLDRGINAIRQVKTGTFVACAAGPSADTATLKRITETVVSLDTADATSIKSFFQWVSSSISVSSQKIESGKEVSGLDELPPPPPELNIVL